MLIRFSVQNFLCFRDEATLSLIASSDDRHTEHLLTSSEGAPPLLKAAAIYGANGHGKTKFVEALRFIERLVLSAAGDEDPPAVRPFRFSEQCRSEPSRFVIEFRSGTTNYEFGIVIDTSGIQEEWLLTKRGQRETLLYERVENERSANSSGFKFGARLRSSKSPNTKFKVQDYLEFLATEIDKCRPFLVEAAKKGIEILGEPLSWFMKNIYIVSADAPYGHLHTRALGEQDFLPFLSKFVRDADIGIDCLSVERNRIPHAALETLYESLGTDFRRELQELEEGERVMVGDSEGPDMLIERGEGDAYYGVSIVTKHSTSEGLQELPLFEESSGTRRLLDLVPMMAQEAEGVITYVVDELDRKLHPLLAYRFLQAFLKSPNVQIVFTTHNTLLLDLDLLRRDEIWFVQKRQDQNVEVYSLADFKIRPDLDVRKGYLNGRFGAIPFLGNVADLGWDQDVDANGSTVGSGAE